LFQKNLRSEALITRKFSCAFIHEMNYWIQKVFARLLLFRFHAIFSFISNWLLCVLHFFMRKFLTVSILKSIFKFLIWSKMFLYIWFNLSWCLLHKCLRLWL
jgi:hypothetical protein